MDISTASTTSMAAGSEPQSLLKFCLLWTVLHRSSPPDICNSVADYHKTADLDKVFFNNHQDLLKTLQHGRPQYQEPNLISSNSNSKQAGNHENSFQFHFKHSSRSLSVIGVLGGIVLILFFVALSTCIKHRRNVNAFGERYHHRENLAREMLVDHIRQLRRGVDGNRSNPSDRPPSYEDVVKDPALADEVDNAIEDPPSYIEATGVQHLGAGVAAIGAASIGVDAISAASSLNSTTLESQSQPNTSSLTTVVTVEAHSTT